ncbi:MAG: DUF4038 domain-containing protein [Bacteroidota bacterium]
MKSLLLLYVSLFVILTACEPPADKVPQWTTYELVLTSEEDYDNPYVDVDVWAVFENEAGLRLTRPAFWDGGSIWKVRFASPDETSLWSWTSVASNEKDAGLHGVSGRLQAVPYTGEDPFVTHGLLKMSPGRRSVVHHDGTSFFLVGDTPWALPWRATLEQAQIYAGDRQYKGFNAALLMSVQPDMNAEGPNARDTPQGFLRGFSDLQDGHVNQLIPEYFQNLDGVTGILLDHGIVPVYQPIFHGFGWKGLQVLGDVIVAEEYVRYVKYLLARYGSRPAIWLISGDGGARNAGIKESGEMLEEWDAYGQPTGFHYNPCDDYVPEWGKRDSLFRCLHENKIHQDKDWLDFQWAQTGHNGEHLYHKVDKMYDNLPTKGVANGEPTYEGMNGGKNGLGWWQGEEAWMQLMSGGTMGVVYGAAGLWQWKVTDDEEGWTDWATQPLSWRGAMDLEGSKYVGYVAKVLGNYDLQDIERRPDLITEGEGFLLAKEGELYISYFQQSASMGIGGTRGMSHYWVNPKTNERSASSPAEGEVFQPPYAPAVLIVENN